MSNETMAADTPLNETIFPIATLTLPSGGRIGVCPLPGGDGNLTADLARVKDWRPDIVLTMTEQSEMDACGVGHLGSLLSDEGIDWTHLPIRDFGGPDDTSAAAWPALSKNLHDRLARGEGILLHCRGGKGRSGMIALRLLVERGEDPEIALQRLRRERPGAVETDEQMAWAAQGEPLRC